MLRVRQMLADFARYCSSAFPVATRIFLPSSRHLCLGSSSPTSSLGGPARRQIGLQLTPALLAPTRLCQVGSGLTVNRCSTLHIWSVLYIRSPLALNLPGTAWLCKYGSKLDAGPPRLEVGLLLPSHGLASWHLKAKGHQHWQDHIGDDTGYGSGGSGGYDQGGSLGGHRAGIGDGGGRYGGGSGYDQSGGSGQGGGFDDQLHGGAGRQGGGSYGGGSDNYNTGTAQSCSCEMVLHISAVMKYSRYACFDFGHVDMHVKHVPDAQTIWFSS